MHEDERKMVAYIAGILYKIVANIELTDNEIQQLDNIKFDLGYHCLKDDEFRY